MDRGAPIREYSPGDSIRIRLTVEHEFDFNVVEARFEFRTSNLDIVRMKSEVPDTYTNNYTITLPGQKDPQLSTIHATTPGHRSEIRLTGKAPAGKALGEYRCTQISTRAPGGSWIPFEFGRTPEIRFRLIPEPVERPRVLDWEFQG
jgi:hypothetical protein